MISTISPRPLLRRRTQSCRQAKASTPLRGLRDGDRVFETYWTNGRGVEVMAPGYGLLLDRTVYGRQETWEGSPPGWPQRWGENTGEPNPYRTNGRPISQWSRLAARRSDDLG